MSLRWNLVMASLSLAFALSGCGGADVASPEEQEELNQQMEQDMQRMRETMAPGPETGGGTRP